MTEELLDAGPSYEEETIQRLRWELGQMRLRVEEANQEAAHWRESFHEAMYYLAVVNVPLAEIAEDSNFQRWRASL